jgi:hypothetical protein
MKKLSTQEQKRIREHAALTLHLSQDTRPEVTRKDIAEFSRDLLSTIQRKRQVKNWVVTLIEIETDGDKS